MLNKFPRKSIDTASRTIEGETVVVIPHEGRVRVLNKTASRIWQLSDGKKSTEEIIRLITDEFNVSPSEAEKGVLNFLDELKEKKMLKLYDEPDMR